MTPAKPVRLLLDVNVLIALFDDDHFFNGKARARFARSKLKIATCPLVENGVMRVLNAPRYSKLGPLGFEPVRQRLIQGNVSTSKLPSTLCYRYCRSPCSRKCLCIKHFRITSLPPQTSTLTIN